MEVEFFCIIKKRSLCGNN